MIDLSRLVFLRAVHRHGSVTAAARELGYTSSAVSQQIGKLQREAGVRLLEPVGRGVVLTDAALVLVDAAVAVEAVAGGYVDVAVVHDWVHDRTTLAAGLESVHLADDPVDLVVPATHRLAGRRTVALSETVDDVWVTDVSDSICTRWILDMLGAATEHPRVDFRAEEYASQLALVSAGLCVAVLPRLGRPALPDTVRVVALRGPVPTRRFLAVHRASTSRRPAVGRLVEARVGVRSRACAADAGRAASPWRF